MYVCIHIYVYIGMHGYMHTHTVCVCTYIFHIDHDQINMPLMPSCCHMLPRAHGIPKWTTLVLPVFALRFGCPPIQLIGVALLSSTRLQDSIKTTSKHGISSMLAVFTASLGSLQNGLQLLRQHHVAFDLQLATHEGLHSIQLAFGHGH